MGLPITRVVSIIFNFSVGRYKNLNSIPTFAQTANRNAVSLRLAKLIIVYPQSTTKLSDDIQNDFHIITHFVGVTEIKTKTVWPWRQLWSLELLFYIQ